MKRFLMPIFVSVFLLSCAGAPRVISYYVDKGIMQYYLMPTTFFGEGAILSIDFTIRIEADKETPATCNFTIKTDKDLPKTVNRAHFGLSDRNEDIELRQIDVLFIEKSNSQIRLTSTMPEKDFKELLLSRDLKFYVESDKRAFVFTPSGDFFETMKDAGIEILDEG
jgi:hypothetical protein